MYWQFTPRHVRKYEMDIIPRQTNYTGARAISCLIQWNRYHGISRNSYFHLEFRNYFLLHNTYSTVADPGGGGGQKSAAAPLFFGRFFFFLCVLFTPEVGLVGGRYPYPHNVRWATFSGLARHRGIGFPALPFHKSWIRHCSRSCIHWWDCD